MGKRGRAKRQVLPAFFPALPALNRQTQGRKEKNSDRDSDETQAVPVLKEHQLFKEIEKTHYCQECKMTCVVLDSGDHHVLTHTELGTWALLAVGFTA
jgi:hypothetical protein